MWGIYAAANLAVAQTPAAIPCSMSHFKEALSRIVFFPALAVRAQRGEVKYLAPKSLERQLQ